MTVPVLILWQTSVPTNQIKSNLPFRWVGEDLQDHEDFIGVYEVDANSLVHAIRDTLLRTGLSLSQCRGQCYDGAANMSGSKGGVAAQLLAEEKRAVYTLLCTCFESCSWKNHKGI